MWLVVASTASCEATLPDGAIIRSESLEFEVWAPKSWIVRHFNNEGEDTLAITRELNDGFPRYLVGFSAATSNILRRQANESPISMARWLCGLAQKRATAVTSCSESQFGRYRRVEWQVRNPAEDPSPEPTMAWVVMLADDQRDLLIRVIFEAPESQWPAVERIGQQMISTLQDVPHKR
jgi:hypothetical protein